MPGPYDRVHIRIARIPAWRAILIAIAVISILIVAALVAFGLFVIVSVAVLIVGAIYALFGKWLWPSAGPARTEAEAIEVEYRVVDTPDADPGPKSLPQSDRD